MRRRSSPSPSKLRFVAFLILALTIVKIQPAGAQTLNVLHNFAGGRDGWGPKAGLVLDRAGSLYGTTVQGGSTGCGGGGCGTIFKLTRMKGGWKETIVWRFKGSHDGAFPVAGLVMDSNGQLFGTTINGGSASCNYGGWKGCGTVYRLAHSQNGWKEKVLHRFVGGKDGMAPKSTLTVDSSGNLFGTTYLGGTGCNDGGCGTVFELSPTGGGWTETILYSFALGSDGYLPGGWVIFDLAGNIYGITGAGGTNSCGTVFELSPSSAGWAESVLYNFCSAYHDGSGPSGGLISDGRGAFYGTTAGGGIQQNGTVFDLVPDSGGGWTENVLYRFRNGPDGAGPLAGVILSGHVYGTTVAGGGYAQGAVFELEESKKGWKDRPLYNFTGGNDGGSPTVRWCVTAPEISTVQPV